MKNTLTIPFQKTPYIFIPQHKVTWNRDISHLKKKFSSVDLDLFLDLYQKAQENPKYSLKEIEEFYYLHQNNPEVLNLLTYVYLANKKYKKANLLIEENYEKNPFNLFARINYGDLCLRRKKASMVPEIFENHFNLAEQYPKKGVFHVSEFRGFMVLMGRYFLEIGKIEVAESYHFLSYQIDPHHISVKVLTKKLYHRPFYKKLINIFYKVKKKQDY